MCRPQMIGSRWMCDFVIVLGYAVFWVKQQVPFAIFILAPSTQCKAFGGNDESTGLYLEVSAGAPSLSTG